MVDRNQVKIKWDAVENAASYEVTCGGQTQTVKSSPATFTGLAWETEHSFTITAKAEAGSEAYLDSEPFEGKVQVGPQYTALDAPANLKATAMGKRVTITWDAVVNAASYEVSCGSSTQTVTTNQATFEMGSSSTEYLGSVVAHPATNSDRYKASEAGTTSVMTDGKEVKASINLRDNSKIVSGLSTTEQIWRDNGIEVHAEKGSSTSNDLGNKNYNPMKVSRGNKLTIQSPYKIKSILFDVKTSNHSGQLKLSIGDTADVLISPSASLAATLKEATNTFVIDLVGSVYMYSVTVTYYEGTMPNTNIDNTPSTTQQAVFGKPWAELPAPSQNPDWVEEASRCVKIITDATVDGPNPRNYAFCYDPAHYVARWVAYPMHSYYTEGSYDSETFYQDPSFASNEQITSTYSDSKNYNRGHQIAKAQRKVTELARRQTNYYTNMTPQNPSLNGGKWATLEQNEREKWICDDTLYVVSGCHFDNYNTTTPNNDGKQCPVPTHYFKVMLRTKAGNTRKAVAECSASELICAGYWVPNVPNTEATTTLMSVSEIERLTGFTFFVNVPNAPKSVVNASDWL